MATAFTQTDDSDTISSTTFATGPAGSADRPFDRILVAVEEETDERVIEVAVSLAAAHNVPIDALSVVQMNSSIDHWDMVVEKRETGAETALETVESVATESGVSVTKQLRYGTPADEISLYAEHNEIDLIVVGEANRTGIRKFFSPTSVAEALNQSASVPVLTVPVSTE